MEERKMILYKDAVRYIEYQYKNESEIEGMIFEHSNLGVRGQVLQYNKWVAKYIGVNILQ
jgi:hypothetical protein